MFSHAAVSNILNNVLSNNTFISLCSNNLFNLSLSKLESYNISKLAASPFIGIINDDPINFSQKANDLYLQYHVPGLLFFHNQAPAALKKEDKYILSQKLSNTTKVFFDNTIRNSWGLSNTDSHTISYGVTPKQSVKTKDVIVLNSTNNSTINTIYQHIKNKIDNSDILTSFIDYDDCLSLISNYKVAVCLENFYDVLCCSSMGCKTITNIDFKDKLPSVTKINDYNTIVPSIIQLLNNDDNTEINQTIEYIKTRYKLNTFLDSMKLILSNFKNRVYIHEA